LSQDIFEEFIRSAFFPGMGPRQRFVFRTHRQQPRQDNDDDARGAHRQQRGGGFSFPPLIHIFLVLVLLFSTLGMNFSNEEPAFSFHPTARYNIQRESHNLKLPYYVNSDFKSKYNTNRKINAVRIWSIFGLLSS
jgi:Domain of unknown function (DUF1977).